MSNKIAGIIFDASVLLNGNQDEDEDDIHGLDSLLRNLRYSEIPFAYLMPRDSHLPKIHIYVVSSQIEDDLVLKLKDSLWVIVLLRSVDHKSNNGISYTDTSLSEYSKEIFIDKVEELPLTICCLIKKAMEKENIKTIAYTMKPSREEDFIKRGALPLCPTKSGLIFLPLSYELPLSSQLQQVDAVLHKVTDEIVSIEISSSDEFIERVTYTERMQELQRSIECKPGFCIIDPFDKIYPVLDRLRIQKILLGLEGFNRHGRQRIRGPHFLKVNSFDEPNLEERLTGAKLSLPNIVKSQVACGVADAHSMAIVFRVDDYKGLNVPLPAILQEYVDHSSCLYKLYVVGKRVFYAIKTSTPNAQTLVKFSENLKPLLFDSLKSLPVVKGKQQTEDNKSGNPNGHFMDIELVTDAANWLRQILDLTIFGFDVVVQEGTGDHVIVDVNYLPSFKEVPDNVAIPAFWDAIKEKL